MALSQSVPALMVFRFFQAFGASAGLSVGSGAIGDIYKLEERGTAMGVFFGVSTTLTFSFTHMPNEFGDRQSY